MLNRRIRFLPEKKNCEHSLPASSGYLSSGPGQQLMVLSSFKIRAPQRIANQSSKNSQSKLTFRAPFLRRITCDCLVNKELKQMNDMIGWMRKNNRATCAARTLAAFFDVVCQFPNLRFLRRHEHPTVNLLFSVLTQQRLYQSFIVNRAACPVNNKGCEKEAITRSSQHLQNAYF